MRQEEDMKWLYGECRRWVGTNDDHQLVAADPDAVSFATTVKELEAELKKLKPDLLPGYGYFIKWCDDLYELPEAALSSYDSEQAEAAARRFGRVRFARTEITNRTKDMKVLRNEDFRLVADQDRIVWLVYRQKRSEQLQKSRSRSPLSVDELYGATEQLLELITNADQQVGYVLNMQLRSTTLSHACRMFVGRYRIALKLVGPKRLRSSQAIAGLVEAWSRNPTKNDQKFREDGPDGTELVETIQTLLPRKAVKV